MTRLLELAVCALLLTTLLLTTMLLPQAAAAADGDTIRSYLEITPADLDDLEALLTTLEQSPDSAAPPANGEPIILILHGDEAFPFTRTGYAANKSLVDRTALLDAYNLIEVKMCETWMNENGVTQGDLLPFIETVPYAPDEVRKLEAEGYQPFGSARM